MGWDCYATRDGRHDDLTAADLTAFAEAAAGLRAAGITPDGLLSTGGLNLSGCGSALAEATGLNVYAEDPTSAAVVEYHVASATWPSPMDEYEAAAKAFADVCAQRGLGIDWSW